MKKKNTEPFPKDKKEAKKEEKEARARAEENKE